MMKQLIFTICLLPTVLFSQSFVTISGKIKNPKKQECSATKMSVDIETYKTKIKTDGSFLLEIPVQFPQTISLLLAGHYTYLAVMPNDEISIFFDEENAEETLTITSDNKVQDDFNRFFFMYYAEQVERQTYEELVWQYKYGTPEALLELVEQMKVERLDYLDYHDEVFEMHPKAKVWAATEIRYGLASILYIYKYNVQYFRKIPLKEVKLSNGFFDTVKDLPINRTTYNYGFKYHQFLGNYSRYFYDHDVLKNKKIHLTPSERMETLIKEYPKIYKGRALKISLLQLLTSTLHNKDLATFKKYQKTIYGLIGDKNYLIRLEYFYYKTQKMIAAIKIPSMAILAENNDLSFEEILKNYKNNVVYVIVWNESGRGLEPYLESLKILQANYKDNSKIKFVFLSTERTPTAWKYGISKYQLSGNHHFFGVENYLALKNQYTSIQSIPHFLVVSKKGKIEEKEGMLPNDKKTRKLLDKLLKKR